MSIREVLFEITAVGALIRVAALDPATNTEVIVFGPRVHAVEALKRAAVRKLHWRLERLAPSTVKRKCP